MELKISVKTSVEVFLCHYGPSYKTGELESIGFKSVAGEVTNSFDSEKMTIHRKKINSGEVCELPTATFAPPVIFIS